MKKLFLSVAVAATFISCNKSTESKTVSEEGKNASYSFGMLLGQQVDEYKSNPTLKDSLDLKSVEKGLRDFLANPEEKNSYAFGMQLGSQVRGVLENPTLSADLSKEQIIQGFVDYINKKDTRIPADSINHILNAYAENQQKKLSEAGKKEGAAFMSKVKTEAGVKTTSSGLAYKVLKEGTGASPVMGDIVKVKYVGKTIDGKIFDSSDKAGQPEGVEFKLIDGALIPGWIEGVQLMKEGAKYELYVPSELGYGDRQAGEDIKPGSTLIFDLELLSVKKDEKPADKEGHNH